MVYLHVLVVIRLRRGSFTADVAGVRPESAVDAHVIFQVVGPVEGLAAHLTTEHLLVLVLFHVSLAVVLSDELRPTVVTSVRSDALVRVHVGRVVALSDERPLALVALERLRDSRGVRPLVQLQVPLGGEVFVADETRVRPLAAVVAYVHLQRRLQVDALADGALDVLRVLVPRREEPVVVGAAHVTRQTRHVYELLVAVRARFGLGVVDLFVPRQLLLRVEHLLAEANVILHLLLDVQVVTVSVLD